MREDSHGRMTASARAAPGTFSMVIAGLSVADAIGSSCASTVVADVEGRNCWTLRHYAELEAMPSEPPVRPESASPPPVKAAMQLPLF